MKKLGKRHGNVRFNQSGKSPDYRGNLANMIEGGTVEKIYAKIDLVQEAVLSVDVTGKKPQFKTFPGFKHLSSGARLSIRKELLALAEVAMDIKTP